MHIRSVLGNSQKLDGGAMFGNAPKEIWNKWYQADELNRINLNCRCLLIQLADRNILLETGIGSFFSKKLKERFGVQEEEHVLLNSLKNINVAPSEITDIILSHLHFDHAGGLLSTYTEGELPKLVFDNARIFVSKKAYQRSLTPHPRDRASFIPELKDLLQQAGKIRIIEGSCHPELPSEFKFHYSDGHTPGLTLTQFDHPKVKLLFVSDLIPGTRWVHLPITMGYDRYPEMLIDEKKSILDLAIKENLMLFYTHDPEFACSQVELEQGKYKAVNAQKVLDITI